MKRITVVMAVFIFCLVCFIPPKAVCEYYEYINEDGVKTFTNDPMIINEIKNKSLKIHKEKYDDLDAEERQRLLKEEQEQIRKQKKSKRKKLKAWDEDEKKEEERKAKQAKEKQFANLKTPIRISGNHVLVPVTIGYSNHKVTTQLVLDTGASKTVIDDSVAGQLQINNAGKKRLVQVAGGGVLTSRLVQVAYVKVGPKTWKNPKIMVLPHSGPSVPHNGLLGQDFLRLHSFTIDYAQNVIKWDK
ncbi:MAG: clan AA aspartic protease [Desulfobacteraceae bacterium]|nr:clan AA aspartic protease [Desulfobacteraceae bacterium]